MSASLDMQLLLEYVPQDFLEPDWTRLERVHEWKRYVPYELEGLWRHMTSNEKALVAYMAQKQADTEEWD